MPRLACLAAAGDGGFDRLVALLDPEIVRREDTGADAVVKARGAASVAGRAWAFPQLGRVVRPALINGAAGSVALDDDKTYAIAALTLQHGRIPELGVLLDPTRLARVDLIAFD